MNVDRRDHRTAIREIGGKNIEGQRDHRKIGPRHFDKQFMIPNLNLADFQAVDDRGEGQHLPLRVPQHREPVVATDNAAIFHAFGMNHEDLPERHHGFHAERRESHIIRLNQIVGDGKHDGS